MFYIHVDFSLTWSFNILDMSPNGLMSTNFSLGLSWTSHSTFLLLPFLMGVKVVKCTNMPLKSSFSFSRCTWFICFTDRWHFSTWFTYKKDQIILLQKAVLRLSFHLISHHLPIGSYQGGDFPTKG